MGDEKDAAMGRSEGKSTAYRRNSKGKALGVVTSLARGWSKQNKEKGREMR